jgi:hypothetical protein
VKALVKIGSQTRLCGSLMVPSGSVRFAQHGTAQSGCRSAVMIDISRVNDHVLTHIVRNERALLRRQGQ